MAEIKVDASHGYDVISEKIKMLVNDIEGMHKAGLISADAAKYLLKQYGGIVKICDEYQDLYIEEIKPKISF